MRSSSPGSGVTASWIGAARRRRRSCSTPTRSRASTSRARRSARATRAPPRRGPSTPLSPWSPGGAARSAVRDRGRRSSRAFCVTRPASAASETPRTLRRQDADASRAHHRRRRSGRLAAGRAAAREGLRGHRRRPARPVRPTRRRSRRSRVECSLVEADLLDHASLARALRATRPTEVYNLAAPSFVPRSWDEPILTAEFAAVGATSMLEAIREVDPVDPLLSGLVERDLRRAARDAADGGDRAEPAHAVRRREGVRALHRGQLSAALRDVHVLRDPLQPRVAPAAGRLPAAQGRASGGGDLPRPRARSSSSATSRRAATGATPATTCARCGSCSSTTSPATTSSRRASRVASRSSLPARSTPCRSTGATTSAPIRRSTAAPPSSTISSATRRRRSACSAGCPRCSFEQLLALMVEADLARLRPQAAASS